MTPDSSCPMSPLGHCSVVQMLTLEHRHIESKGIHTMIKCRLDSADWIGVKILNMFNTGSLPTITK